MAEDDVVPPVRQAFGSSGQSPDAGVARDLSELARQMQAERSMDALLRRVADAAVAEIEAAQFAGISEIEGKRVHTRAGTAPLVRQIDDLQHRAGDGPCLTSLRDEVTILANDLATDPRWPRFTAAAAEHGVRSMLSVQLFVEGDNLGALNLYATKVGAFDDADENIAMLLASHAAIAIKGSRIESNLRTALATRDIIGQAKGILMERFKINQAEAFDLLVAASQHLHRKLHDIADELAATGELPLA